MSAVLDFLKSLKMNPDDAEMMAKGIRVPQPRFDAARAGAMAIPALGGALMAGASGAGLEMAGIDTIKAYTDMIKDKAKGKSSQQLAKAVEAAYGDSNKGKKK